MVMTESRKALVELLRMHAGDCFRAADMDTDVVLSATQISDMSDAMERAADALEAGGWRPLRDAPYGEEVVVHMGDGSDLVGAIKQGNGDWWWRGVFWPENRIEAWRPIGLPSPPAPTTAAGVE